MVNPAAQLPFRSLRLLAATLAATMLGCGGQSAAPSPSAQSAAPSPSAQSAAPSSGARSVAVPSASGAAAQSFLSLLDEKERAAASFPFDDPERVAWAYVPRDRAGVPLKAMHGDERAAALGLLGTGLSERGMRLARGIIDLEGTLRELEAAAGSPMAARRDTGLYYLTLFGRPDTAEPWGWRFEGHHLSVNVTELGPHGQIVAPLFMGANPARVASGPKKGLRVLAEEEDLAFELLRMLDPGQRARATIANRTAGDILTRNDPAVGPMALSGLPAAEMTADQQGKLRRLVESYAGRMSDTAARGQLARIEQAGFGRLHFAWAGAHQRGEAHYYRIHGPTVLIEYDNTQGGANHIHTVWRDLENDFGGDLLRRHYARQPHGR